MYICMYLSPQMGQVELLFYNTSIVLLPATLLALFTGDLQKVYEYSGWSNPMFLLNFALACIMGCVDLALMAYLVVDHKSVKKGERESYVGDCD